MEMINAEQLLERLRKEIDKVRAAEGGDPEADDDMDSAADVWGADE